MHSFRLFPNNSQHLFPFDKFLTSLSSKVFIRNFCHQEFRGYQLGGYTNILYRFDLNSGKIVQRDENHVLANKIGKNMIFDVGASF